MQIECANKLGPIITTPKRVKILVGGRASTKSTFASDYVLSQIAAGQLWCCAREFQNSIDESVHRLMLDEIDRTGMQGFSSSKTDISHVSGGRNFYKGLARNIASLKSTLSGVDGLWIEEGETLSENTLRVLTASLRVSAKDSERIIAGEDVRMPEILITMNRGSRQDPVAKKWLARAEPDLERCGYYEDDALMVIEINYNDIPRKWFEASGLEVERADDEAKMSRPQYEHKWLGKYLESVEDAIIQPEWFDACVDAHLKLGFKPRGLSVVAHDPADSGDARATAHRHGSVILQAYEDLTNDVNDSLDDAMNYALDVRADAFIWDADGLGLGLKRQVGDTLSPKGVDLHQFRGCADADRPNAVYKPVDAKVARQKTNKEQFVNKRAQYYAELADRMYATYRAVEKGEYFNPDDMISFSSEIKDMRKLKAEVCRIPRVRNRAGRFQIMSKIEMKQNEIESPNLSDSIMMSLAVDKKSKNMQQPATIVPTAYSAFR